jgi:hypothetical protein
MLSKFLLLLAASVFLAFTSITPADLLATKDAALATPVDRIDLDPVLVHPAGASVAVPGAPAVADLPSPIAPAVATAVSRLGSLVARTSHPEALEYAFRAYYTYRTANPQDVRKPYLYFVDFGLDSRTPRGYVFDMDALRVVEGPFNVAHGRGSVVGGAEVPTRFLNAGGSNATSLGLYVAQETYGFSGVSGGRSYRSIGLRLRGVSGRFNSAARDRGIVVHGAPYVTPAKAGRSEGCPAMELELAQELIPRIANGGLVFHFSPYDTRWMREDPWAGAVKPGLALGR